MPEDKKSKSSKDKLYVIDTNVILTNPNFENEIDGKILIPDIVLKELDEHKKGFSETAINAREFARKLDKNFENYSIGKTIEGNITNDLKIIEMVRGLHNAKQSVALVTEDLYMSSIARSLKLEVIKYSSLDKPLEIYKGVSEKEPSLPNEYQITKSGVYKNKNGEVVRLEKDKKIFGIQHKNAEQKCLIDALLDDDIKLVTVIGAAGTGKTLLSIVCGLQKVLEEGKYNKLVVARPIAPMGNEIGFLPGEINEKLAPWMQPIFDNIDYIFSTQEKKKRQGSWVDLEAEGFIKLEALTYIRGRSIPNEFILIDEAQNLSVHEIKTIVTRAGQNTKIVMTGDIYQIDNPKLDKFNNGLTYLIEKMKDEQIAAHITLTKCERSELAKIAGEKL
jgi:PhoH-like ATPase